MKKTVSFIAILTAFVFLFMTISYALDNTEFEKNKSEEEEETFFEVSSEEVTTGDTVEMVLNLSLVNATSFIFKLSSSVDISTIYTDEESEVEIAVEENNGEYTITIEVTDSSLLTSSEIALYYDLSDSVISGTAITLTATVTDSEDEENTETVETTVTVTDSEVSEESNYNDNVNNGEEDSENNEFESSFESENSEQADAENMMNGMLNDETTSTQEDTAQSEKSTDSASTSVSFDSASTEETVTYDGSSNNYLSELSIDGYSLNKDFDKESSTYFVTVSDVESITVNATAEDSTATVCIYGTDSIEDGTNKVIISVTAENGSVRYYRIYVSK